MHKTHRNSHEFDIQRDIAKIKAALAATTYDVTGKTKEMIQESLDDLKDKSAEMHDALEHYVVKKPLKSIGIAMFIGAVIGYLMHK